MGWYIHQVVGMRVMWPCRGVIIGGGDAGIKIKESKREFFTVIHSARSDLNVCVVCGGKRMKFSCPKYIKS